MNGVAQRDVREDGHGGTGIVDGLTLPGTTVLFTGPDPKAARARVIPAGSSVLVAHPILCPTARAETGSPSS